MKPTAYYDGCFSDIDSVRIPLSDRAYFFGDAVYDAALGRNGKPFMLDSHIARFKRSASLIGLKMPISDTDLRDILARLTESLSGSFFFLYFQLSARGKARAHARDSSLRPALFATVSEIKDPAANPPARLICREDKRYKLCNVKTINLLPAVLASTEAEELGADEAVFVKDGTVTECAHSNIHIIKNERLFTHPEGSSILSGISRAHLLEVCKRLGVSAHEKPFTKDELLSADEVLITSSSKIARRVSEIDGKSFPLKENTVGFSIYSAMLADFYSSTV